jgi:anti-anti-sigma regulatory factor
MSIDVDGTAAPRRLTLTGAVDVSHAGALHAAALAVVGGTDVVAELAGVTRIDTAALQVLLALRTALDEHGARLIVAGTPLAVVDAWRLAGVAEGLV